MYSVTTLNGRELPRFASLRVRPSADIRSLRLARQNAALTLDNIRPRVEYQQLLSTTEICIRLNEAALERANAAVVECWGLQQVTDE
jgi:hypothetical protein